ncbi:MEDS domain-containing protein [Haloterrigena salifodinae]|uniref:histidine kinase n=1 Tax=Haloterrigena salifodinae TaxID=2675099 RepID=A0A8T8E2A8_9EURY|nr:MEDS domain-containing protein [Haloterrigena salifodinae]QRV15994.1 MEDS domain-containing protein [Haloterrigena salifodinae]
MSQQGERSDQPGTPGLESGLEALRQSPEFRGPVEPPDSHDHVNDHFALIYKNRDEQFAAAIPFIRQGLEQGERCLYVADDNSKAEVLEAMRAYGIDVDGALDSGALSVHTEADTYRRTGAFDQDAMLEFWEDSLTEATDEDGYTGIRAAAEMTWALDEDTSPDQLVEYEAALNSLFQNEDYTVMCQYNRERFPPEVLEDVIETHPHLIHDNMVSHNVYYTPPEEFFGPEQPADTVDRMMGNLREQTEAKTELQQSKEHFKQIFESSHDAILIVDPDADEILDANPAASEMFGYARDELLARGPSDLYPDEHDRFSTFVDEVVEDGIGWTDELTCRTRDGVRIPTEISASQIEVDDRPVMFAAIRDITERKEHEQAQQRLYEIVADSDRPFDDKLQAVLELGCERFDLEYGGIARIDPTADLFEVETIRGDHDHLVPGEQYPLSETYCRLVTGDGETAAVSDPVSEGFEGKLCYERFGVQAYLGSHLEVDGDVDRTFFFVSNEPRKEGFSEAERTFHHLMGQWVEYELERRQAAEELREQTHTLETINQVGNSLAAELDLENLVQEVTDAGTEITGAEFGAFFYNVIDDQGESYTLYTLSGVPDEEFKDFPMPRNTEVFGPTFHGEGVVRSDDITKDPRYGKNAPYDGMPEGHLPVCSYLAVPVISNSGEVHGGLFFGHSERGIFTEKDENIITGIAAQAAVAIDNARLYETARESEERFRALVTASSEAVFRMSSDWNKMNHLEAQGFLANTNEPTSDWLDKYILPGDQERIMEAVNEAVRTKSTFELEHRVEQVDGSLGWSFTRAVPMLNEDGDIEEWIGMASDITDRKHRQQELEQTNAQLERSNAELKRFAYAASHDLQEPLRMVSSYVQLLEQRYADDLDADAQEYIEFAVDGADRMREMIDALLQYSRLNTSDNKFEPVDCNGVLAQATDNLQIAIEESSAEITSDSLPTVMGDEQQLVQLFQNLLDNAITYAGDEPPHIHVTAEKQNDEWVLSVQDNGIGIDSEKAEEIFEVFNRLHTPDEYAGTGIGLALCQRIVDIHNGRIWVESELGEGSTFSFTVPEKKASKSA